MGLRGCSDREAFDELVSVVKQTGVGIGRLAAGLVAVAGGSASADHAEAFSAWGDLIEHRPTSPKSPTLRFMTSLAANRS